MKICLSLYKCVIFDLINKKIISFWHIHFCYIFVYYSEPNKALVNINDNGTTVNLLNDVSSSLTIHRPLNDGFWHYVCLTWSSATGTWIFYVDGQLATSGKYGQGHTVSGQ